MGYTRDIHIRLRIEIVVRGDNFGARAQITLIDESAKKPLSIFDIIFRMRLDHN